MIRYILYAIIFIEVTAIMVVLGQTFWLAYREYKTPQHNQTITRYQRSLENVRHRAIIANLSENPYVG